MSTPYEAPGWAQTMRRTTDHMVCDFLGGPRPWKFAWVINLQKLGKSNIVNLTRQVEKYIEEFHFSGVMEAVQGGAFGVSVSGAACAGLSTRDCPRPASRSSNPGRGDALRPGVSALE